MEKTVKNRFENELIVDKSRFLSFLVPLTELSDAETILKDYINEFKGARHYCYAYRFKGQEKFSDDGEPRNTAGLPLLNVLQKQKINDAMLVVIRYFGGKKLGAGRLLRTYSQAGLAAVNEAHFYTKKPGYSVTIEIDFTKFDEVKYQLADYGEITSTLFKDYVALIELSVPEEEIEPLTNHYNVINKKTIEIYEEI